MGACLSHGQNAVTNIVIKKLELYQPGQYGNPLRVLEHCFASDSAIQMFSGLSEYAYLCEKRSCQQKNGMVEQKMLSAASVSIMPGWAEPCRGNLSAAMGYAHNYSGCFVKCEHCNSKHGVTVTSINVKTAPPITVLSLEQNDELGALSTTQMWDVKLEERFYDSEYVLVARINATERSGIHFYAAVRVLDDIFVYNDMKDQGYAQLAPSDAMLGNMDHISVLMYVRKDLARDEYTLPLRQQLAMRAITPARKNDQ